MWAQPRIYADTLSIYFCRWINLSLISSANLVLNKVNSYEIEFGVQIIDLDSQ